VEGARLPFWGEHPVTEGQEVVYGIRPEHLELADDGFPATVDVVEPTGSETMVFLHVGSKSIVALFRERHDFKPGQTVRLRPKPASAHLFDARSGKRL
jgi:multiple sugar transport system ATP-binding protein